MSGTITETGLIPLTTVEFFFHQREDPRQPANMHVELRVPGRLDESRVRDAVVSACDAHPMSRARLAPGGRGRSMAWELVDLGEFDMERVVRVGLAETGAELGSIRNVFFSTYLDIHQAPAFHLLIVHRPDGDTLLISINHTISDGAGGLRFTQSIARAYAGQSDPATSKDPIASRYLMNDIQLNPPEPAPGPPRRRTIATKIRPQPASVDRPSSGLTHIALSEEEVRGLDPRRYAPDATLNDLLLGAFLRSIDAWNARKPDEDCNLVIAVPFNPRHLVHLRPTELMINMSMAGRLIAGREQLVDERTTMTAVVEQTQWLKDGGIDVVPTLPGWAQTLVVAAMPVLKHWGRPTAFFTYLGRSRGLDFGPAGSASELWVSGGTGMPTGLLIGASLLNGALFLTFSYRHALFNEAAAERFAELYLSQLRALGSPEKTNQA